MRGGTEGDGEGSGECFPSVGEGIHLRYDTLFPHFNKKEELAEHLEITPAAVTGVLQRLEGEGYIERTLGADNRFNEISITEKGRETVKLSREAFRKVDRAIFDGLNDEEVDVFIEIVGKIKKNAEKYRKYQREYRKLYQFREEY